MSETLYNTEIKRLAALPAPRLSDPDAAATLDNPLCGDRVTVEVRLKDGRIQAVGYAVRGCLLCQAAAATLAARAVGMDAMEAVALAAGLRAMLKEDAPPPAEPLTVFTPAARHRSRHDCVLLPFQALAETLRQEK